MSVLSYDEFVQREEDYYDAGERLMEERGVRSNGTMTQLCLYAEIAYLRDELKGIKVER